MDFWNTILGHHLADVLIRTLPQLAQLAEKEQSEQYPVTCGATNAAVLSVFQEEKEKGGKFISAIPTANNQVVLFFERTVND